ncbi:MAG: head GIN domain-containing protein [Ginsengibacter sp.]
MKKLLIAVFALLSVNAFAQKWEKIKGNGHIKKETREVSNFTSLASQGSMDVKITYGNSNSIVVEADENLLPYIETTVENGKLFIRPKKNVNLQSGSKMIVHVSMTKMNSVQLSGSGNISGSGAFTNDATTDVGVSGSGNLSLNFDTFKDLDLSISGSGNIDLKGNATNSINAKVSGSGNIDCSDISSNDVDAKLSGSGNIKVYAKNSIDAKISGSGNVFYKGEAPKISSKVVGSGKVLKM